MYSIYVGATNRDLGESIALDSAGRAWITGRTASIGDFPTVAPTQAAIGGEYDAFVVEIDPARSGVASLVFSTFLGGGAYDEGTGIAIDSLADIYVTGFTSSTNFPVHAAFQPTNADGNEAFIVKFGNPAAGTLASVSVNPATVTGGKNSTGTVTLSSAAGTGRDSQFEQQRGSGDRPDDGARSSGQTSATFNITTAAVATATTATITATYNGISKTAALTINPAPPTLSAVSVNPTAVTGGTGSTGTVTLTAAAPTGRAVVTPSSNNASASVPAPVTVAANATTATFTITTSTVTVATTATITATYSGVSKTATLTVNPAAALSAVSVNPTSVTSGASSTGTVTLSAAAPAGGAVVTLSSNSTSATVPASVTVAANATTATFTITTTSVAAAKTATVTATTASARPPH